jgi:hypothetical protein
MTHRTGCSGWRRLSVSLVASVVISVFVLYVFVYQQFVVQFGGSHGSLGGWASTSYFGWPFHHVTKIECGSGFTSDVNVTYKWNYADLALNVLVCSLLVVTTCVAAYRLSRRLHWPLKLAISDVFQILTCVAILLAFCNTYRLPGSSVHASPLQWHPWLWFQPWYVQSAALIGLVSCIYCSVLVTCLLARWFLNLLIQHLLPVERQVIDV